MVEQVSEGDLVLGGHEDRLSVVREAGEDVWVGERGKDGADLGVERDQPALNQLNGRNLQW